MAVHKKGTGRKDECRTELTTVRDFRAELPSIIDNIVRSHSKDGRFSHVGPEPIPSRQSVIDIINMAMKIIYPGYFSQICLDEVI